MSALKQLGKILGKLLGDGVEEELLSEGSDSGSSLDLNFLSDLLPYRIYNEEQQLFENKSSVGFVLEIPPLVGVSRDIEQELSSLTREIGQEGASIQCLLWADNRIDPFVKLWKAPRQRKGGIFQKVAEKREDFLKQPQTDEVPSRIFRFFFSYSLPKRKNENPPYEDLKERKKKALATFSRFAEPNDLGPTDLIRIVSGIMNFSFTHEENSRKNWQKDRWLSQQIPLPGGAIEIRKDFLKFGDRELFKTYEVVDYPEHWTLLGMRELIGDFFNRSYQIQMPFYVHYGIYFPNQQKKNAKFATKSKLTDHQSKFGALYRLIPTLGQEVVENQYVRKELMEGEMFIETRLSVGLFSLPDQMIRTESTLLSLFRKYGFRIEQNHYLHLPDLLSSLPMAWGGTALHIKAIKRTRAVRTTLTLEVSKFFPIIGEWWGNSTEGMFLFGRRGQICTWDPFEVEGNLNSIVIGPSGSGKSVFMQEMIMSHLGNNGRVFVLDLGRSFEKLCHLVDGQHLNFSGGSGLNLNPFHLIQSNGNVESINIAIEMVSSIVATMAMPSQKIDKERADLLSSLVRKVWETKGTQGTIDDLILLLNKISFDSELMLGVKESLIEGLKKYTKNGTYSHYFYGTKPADFSNDLVVIETEELKTMPDLQAVVLQIFTLHISNQIFMGDREKRSLICIDEAWDLLKSPQMEGFIESLARRLRKYNGALVIGTQGIKDFDRSPGARAAFQNSNWLLMLGKDDESINALKKENLIPMDEYKEQVLRSLKKEDGKYSEVFIYHKGSGFHTACQLKLDPFSAMLYSTKAREFQLVLELQEIGYKIEDAIEWLLEHKATLRKLEKEGYGVKDSVKRLTGKGNCLLRAKIK